MHPAQEAAALRDELAQAEAEAAVPTESDTVTDGVRVRVQSFYVPAQSSPSMNQYYYAYHVTVTNEHPERAVQLRARHWVITDGAGGVEEVRGQGVVGEQPLLAPGQWFSYTSACPLRTDRGTMEGEYTVEAQGPLGEPGPTFEVKIGRFGLSTAARPPADPRAMFGA